jgi:hypothetical protein
MNGRETRDERRETRENDAVVRRRGPLLPRTSRSLLSRLSSLGLCLALACDPGTTRPDLIPFPEARTIEVIQERRDAIESLRRALVAESLPVARFDTVDLWLDTPWFDARTLQPTGSGALGTGVVKLRGWADPTRPGHSMLVVELVYRPMADPSVPPRQLERPVAPTDSIHARVGRALKAIEDEFGAHH